MLNLLPTLLVLAASVSLYFGQPPKNIPVGLEFKIPIFSLSDSEQTLGTDAVVSYDSKILSVTKIEPGSLYPFYPDNLQDIDNVHGKAFFSGSVGFGNPQTVNGILGNVFFKAKKAGPTQISFSWKPKSTVDSHIVPPIGAIDLLTQKPDSINLTIREAQKHELVWFFIKDVFSFDYLKF